MSSLDAALLAVATGPWALLVLIAVCAIDGFFPVAPSETVLVAVGAATWSADPSRIVLVVMGAVVGAWAGDNLAYLIGRRVGMVPLPWLRRPRYLAAARRTRLELTRRPESLLLTGRFIPFGRVVLNFAAGAGRVPYQRFLLLSALGAAVWASAITLVVVLAGSMIGAQPVLLTGIVLVLAVLGGAVVDRVMATWRQRQATAT